MATKSNTQGPARVSPAKIAEQFVNQMIADLKADSIFPDRSSTLYASSR